MSTGRRRLVRPGRTPSLMSRLTWFVPFVLVGVIVFAVGIPVRVETVAGFVRSHSAQLDIDGKESYLVVELGDGQRVNVRLSESDPIRTGVRVELHRHKTLIGDESYTFVRYL